MATMASTPVFAQQWLTPTTKQFLKQRIRTLSKVQLVSTSDQAIAEQYYRMWLQIPTSNPLQRLIRHPLLTSKDKQTIDNYVHQQQQSQLKTSGVLTGGLLSVYWLFMSRSSFFQNFFNNKQRHWVWNFGRKGLGVYFVFLGALLTMNSHYEKKIPNGLDQMGIFKKYRITYQEKYV